MINLEKKKSVKANFLYNTVFQIFIYIIPLITIPYVSRILGAEHIGQYSYAMSIVTYFTMFATLGTGIHGQRKIAYYRDDKSKLSEAFWNILCFRLITSTAAILLYVAYLRLFAFPFTMLELVVTLNIVDVAVDVSWFFQGLEEFKQTVIRGFAVKVIGLICIFLFIRDANDTWKYALILLGATILGSLSLWRYIPRLILKPKHVQPFHDIKDTILVFLPTIATQVYSVLDKSMISWITKSDYENGCYEQSEKIVRVLMIMVSSASTVMLPRIANLYSEKNYDEIKRYVYKGYRVVFMLSIPFMFGLISVASVFMPLYLGSGYDMSVNLLIIFTWILVAEGMSSATGLAYLVPTKQQNAYTVSLVIAAVLNFCMNLYLIPRIGAYGSALSSIIAETMGSLIQVFYCVKTGQLSIKQIFVPSWRYAVSGIIMFAALMFLKHWLTQGIVSLCILVLTGVLVYVLMLIFLRDELAMYGIKKFGDRVSKINKRSQTH